MNYTLDKNRQGSLDDVVGEVISPQEKSSHKNHLPEKYSRKDKFYLAALPLCTFVLGSVPAAAVVAVERVNNTQYGLNIIYGAFTALIFVPVIEETKLNSARIAGLIGAAFGATSFYFAFKHLPT